MSQDHHAYSFPKAVACAWNGIVTAWTRERHMRVHFWFLNALVAFLLITRPTLLAVAVSLGTAAVVIAGELFNTAIEATVDLIAGENYYPQAKLAKDASSGAVLVLAVGSLGVAAYLVTATYPWHFELLSAKNTAGAVLGFIFLVIAWVAHLVARRHKHHSIREVQK